jgi:xylulokinase
MYLLGIDVGTSSVKVSVVDATTQQEVDAVFFPESEAPISAPHPGWAEQDPEHWWSYTKSAISKIKNNGKVALSDISAIGISYQMHGLVMVDAIQQVIRPAIIWCDSRAVTYGDKAFDAIGHEHALKHLLNSPGNFTASKLAWVKENQPDLYDECAKFMLPGDFIAMKLSGEISTTNTALSEGIFWDFQTNSISQDILKAFGIDESLFPQVKPVFSVHATVSKETASELGLKPGTPISYKAGDQPNNALSLNVFEPGEVAATAGTSGVIYAITDQRNYDAKSRINVFAHVNHQQNNQTRLGQLLCINGTGIANAWMKRNLGENLNYPQMNILANIAPIGSKDLLFFPFGNGVERVLNNSQIPSIFHGLNFNIHNRNHLFRATQEGIAFSLIYGLEILQELSSPFEVMRACKTNLFLSNVFTETLVNCSGIPVEMYETTGAKGAALGAGIGAGIYKSNAEAFEYLKKINVFEPNNFQKEQVGEAYQAWKTVLTKNLI